MSQLSYEEANRLIAYETGTGYLIRKVDTGRMHKAGAIVGTKEIRRIKVNIGRRSYLAHRIVWLLCYRQPPTKIIDHIDGNPHNNEIENLRQATHSQNSRNARLGTANKTGCVGVKWRKRDKRFYAFIHNNAGRQIHLGCGSFEKCTRLRKAAEKIYGYHENHGKLKEMAPIKVPSH